MNGFKASVELQQVFTRYYENILMCSFTFNGEDCAASQVFHQHGFLPLIVEIANDKSQQLFSESIQAEITPHSDALLGRAVTLTQVSASMLLLLIRAAELIFKPTPGKTIELYPVFEYGAMPLEQRSRSVWQLAHF